MHYPYKLQGERSYSNASGSFKCIGHSLRRGAICPRLKGLPLSLSFSKATLISPILMRSRWLAVFLRYLLMGADLGLGLGIDYFYYHGILSALLQILVSS